ncbi:hypothetical protein C2S53_003229 [Perilla frutescens var. hirtella]|uniref:Uncharacterized protein n=1 Tax=Perilla frutescens var. hirtella TaxID=608512 RepID=A0AAD4JK76_PERFH|nr:hypothetical protein C2S53_003229 [Perilla frutescens var. hirtella]
MKSVEVVSVDAEPFKTEEVAPSLTVELLLNLTQPPIRMRAGVQILSPLRSVWAHHHPHGFTTFYTAITEKKIGLPIYAFFVKIARLYHIVPSRSLMYHIMGQGYEFLEPTENEWSSMYHLIKGGLPDLPLLHSNGSSSSYSFLVRLVKERSSLPKSDISWVSTYEYVVV